MSLFRNADSLDTTSPTVLSRMMLLFVVQGLYRQAPPIVAYETLEAASRRTGSTSLVYPGPRELNGEAEVVRHEGLPDPGFLVHP